MSKPLHEFSQSLDFNHSVVALTYLQVYLCDWTIPAAEPYLKHVEAHFKFFDLFSVLRQPTQDAPEEVRTRDFRRELEERERVAARDKTRERGPRGCYLS